MPAYVASAGDEAIELAAMAGLELDPWQQWVLRHSLGERADGKWAAFQVGLVVGRQNGKNVVLEARELAEVFLVAPQVGPRVVVHSAHQFKTSLEHYRRLKARIRSSPEMLAKVKRVGKRLVGFRDSHGEEGIEFEDGSRILFVARTKSGGQARGFSADLLVWDESMNLPDAVVGDVMPTVSARTGPEFLPGPQVWYTGSAVNQQTMPYGVQLARIRDRGIAGDDPGLFYAEWSIDDAEYAQHPEIMDDPAYWGQANPGLGRRIAVEHVQLERAGAMPPAEFLVERGGIGDWPPTSPDAARVISQEAWNTLADPVSKIHKAHSFALDVDPGQAWATLAVAGEREDGLFHVAVVEHQRGTAWVVDECRKWLDLISSAQLVVDPRADLGALIQELEDAAIRPIRTTAGDYKDACGGFFQAVIEKRLRYKPPQPELDAAVAGATTQPLLDAWKWSRKSGALITPLVACTLALWGSRTQAPPQVHSLAPKSPDEPPPSPGRFVPLEQAPMAGGLFR